MSLGHSLSRSPANPSGSGSRSWKPGCARQTMRQQPPGRPGGCASPLLPKARIEGFVIDRGLANLYDAMETGEFGSGELAPRTRSLFQKREDLA